MKLNAKIVEELEGKLALKREQPEDVVEEEKSKKRKR
jgi:hypothetical protein